MISGHSKVCGANSGGVNTLGIADKDVTTGMTVTVTDGVITALTLAVDKKFKGYEFDRDTCLVKGDGSNGVEHSIAFYLRKAGKETRKAAKDLKDSSSCGMVSIVEQNNGERFLVGYSELSKCKRALEIEKGDLASGSAITDKNGADFELKSSDSEYSLPIDVAVDIDAIIEYPAIA